MNGKGFVRVLEALLASGIMIISAVFIVSEQGGEVVPPSPGEITEMKQMGNDILSVLEKNRVTYEGELEEELALYIRTKDQYTLSERLNDIIPQEYGYDLDIYRIENLFVIPTEDRAVDQGGLTNGYTLGVEIINYNDIWHYKEGGYTFDLPDTCDLTATLVVVDTTNENPYSTFDYDAFYINFGGEPTSFVDNEDLPVNPVVPLQPRDFFRIYDTSNPNVHYEQNLLVSEITPDGNSVSMGLIRENIIIHLDGTGRRDDVSIMNVLYDFEARVERGRWSVFYGKNDAHGADLDGPYSIGDWMTIENYDIVVEKVDDEVIHLSLLAHRRKVLSASVPISPKDRVVCNRVLAVREGTIVNFYYISLMLGRCPREG
jgi:hypothetical protein